jgi:hypothetical protein
MSKGFLFGAIVFIGFLMLRRGVFLALIFGFYFEPQRPIAERENRERRGRYPKKIKEVLGGVEVIKIKS